MLSCIKKISLHSVIASSAAICIAIAIVLYAHGASDAGNLLLGAVVFAGTAPLIVQILMALAKGRWGVDVIAMLALVTSLLLHQYLAGAVILLMYSGGQSLEAFATTRARKELTTLLSNAPRAAHKKIDDQISDVSIDVIAPGDTVVVKPGEIVPVDGRVREGVSLVDESMLTGESMPLEKGPGAEVMSGSINHDAPLEIETMRASADSNYQHIIRLIQSAESRKAPFVRLADRYGAWFTVVTLALAGFAWLLSHDAVRVLAVLVVATPCPLILAAPVAFASGVSRAARRGIIVKNAGALEQLARTRVCIFDKTGTLTLGVPSVASVRSFSKFSNDQILRIAASLDQLSVHVLARSLIHYVREKNIALKFPQQFQEFTGKGVTGSIETTSYLLGRLSFVTERGVPVGKEVEMDHARAEQNGIMAVYIATREGVIGAVYFVDQIRGKAKEMFMRLKSEGVKKLVMITGDKKTAAEKIAQAAGIHEVYAECLPEDKLRHVEELRARYRHVAMVGDGVNDAPALAAADVGIAMGAHGSTAASEAGDVVIMVDTIERVGEIFAIGKLVLSKAEQSIAVGIGLSIALMLIASFGFIMPVAGAILQEAIDVVVILNALRVHFVRYA